MRATRVYLSIWITTRVEDEDDQETELHVEAQFTPAQPDTWMHPGDPETVELLSLHTAAGEVSEDSLTDSDLDRVHEAVRSAVGDR